MPHFRIDDPRNHDRQDFTAAIQAIYREDHARARKLLENKPGGWREAFVAQRKATMHKVAEKMPELFKRYPGFLSEEEYKPRDPSCFKSRPGGAVADGETFADRDFRVVILNADKELGFFTVALVFDPGQCTSPHTHKTLCFGVPYKGRTVETVFDLDGKTPHHSIVRDRSDQIEIATPERDGDLHAVGNPEQPGDKPDIGKMAVQIHLYDGYDLRALLEDGVVKPMITGTPGEKLSGARQSFQIKGYPCPHTGMRI